MSKYHHENRRVAISDACYHIFHNVSENRYCANNGMSLIDAHILAALAWANPFTIMSVDNYLRNLNL